MDPTDPPPRGGRLRGRRPIRLDAPRAARALAEARAAAVGARREVLLFAVLLTGVLVVYDQRSEIAPGFQRYVRYLTVVALIILGVALARSLGRAFGPQLLRRLDPGTAGTVGFLIRLLAVLVALVAALRIAGVSQSDLAVGGAFTAVVLGLAAQQTLGNFFAGTVLLSVRPFRAGDRVRFQSGSLAGSAEGTVDSLGLMYVTLREGADLIYVPNSAALASAVRPLREPDGVDFSARLRPGVRMTDVQRLLEALVDVPTRSAPQIDLESVDDEETVVRIRAVPVDPDDGWRLADQVLAAVDKAVSEDMTLEHVIGERPVSAPADRIGAGRDDGPAS